MLIRGPYEVKPRQLRALVLLLALLPLIPMTFVVRFVSDDIASQRLEARERARPVYQKFLDSASVALAASVEKQLPPAGTLDPRDPWRWLRDTPGAADTVLLAMPDGRLSAPPPAAAPDDRRAVANAEALAGTVTDGGIHYAPLPRTGPVRWRFLGETREIFFGLHPHGPAAASPVGNGQTLLLIETRQHLLDKIAAFYHREVDPQLQVRLRDENDESIILVGPTDAGAASGEGLGETLLRPPLPAWRVQLFSPDSSPVDGIAREQITFYWWSVVAMILVTTSIAVAGGWALTRRIALHELSNDALAVVSHEMKTPLASTRLLIETLLERRYRGGEQAADEYLQLIAAENRRLERMIEDFQTLSRLEHPRRDARPRLALETVTAAEIVALARDRLRPRLEAPGCDFRVEIDAGARPFQADRNALAAVLVNLLDNALKYSGDEKRIVLRAGVRDRQMVFEVGDNGTGIDSGDQERIFERFYQGDRRLSRVHEGCGLGLSIVRSVARAHGGGVAVTSTPGAGSTFTVRVPLKGKAKDEG